jgi:hypothetical protein
MYGYVIQNQFWMPRIKRQDYSRRAERAIGLARPINKLITSRRQQVFDLGGVAKAQISRRRICL